MNEQLQQALTELCDKLGTTVEHLWTVLIRQAYISGTTNLVTILVCGLACVWSFKFVHKKTKTPPATEDDRYPCAEWEDEAGGVAWVVWAILTFSYLLGVVYSAESIIGSLFNPEYWALKQLIP